MPERKEALTKIIEVCQKHTKANWRAPDGQNGTNVSKKNNEVELDYNLKYKINIHNMKLINY